MAYSQLGYPYATGPQFLMASSPLRACLESATPPSHTVLGSPGHQLTPGTGVGAYSGSYPKSQAYYSGCPGDASALYTRGAPEPKEGASVHVGSSQTPAYYPYEYTFGQYPYDRYGYSSSDGAARRKNATRETTSTLKAWLQEHQKNPYPTKGEKIMLAIITRMTLTQVSTWFANARRRLKKENKVTWSPRTCKSSDDRGCDDSDEAEKPLKCDDDMSEQPCGDLQSDLEDFDLLESDASDSEPKPPFLPVDPDSTPLLHSTDPQEQRLSPDCHKLTPVPPQTSFYASPELHSDNTKPKIWSIARTAVPVEEQLQPEYPSCMLSSTGSPSDNYPPSMALSNTGSPSDNYPPSMALSNTGSPSDNYPPSMALSNTGSPSDNYPPSMALSNTGSPSDNYPPSMALSNTGSPSDNYPPSMALSNTGSPSDNYPPSMALSSAERQQESPVATLREWVDGVFHSPSFHQSRSAGAWQGLSESMTDNNRTPGPL